MASNWGENIKLSLFGESHGAGIGVVLDGLPAGEAIDLEELAAFCLRRTPGRNRLSTQRKEADTPTFLSGFVGGKTTGTPLAVMIANSDTRSGDYKEMQTLARPGHADYTGFVRYGGSGDIRGGGHFSARLTAPLVVAGGIALQILARQGITIGAHIRKVHTHWDTPLDPVTVTAQQLLEVTQKEYPVIDDKAGQRMRDTIEAARLDCDSVGGIVECCAVGVPVGIGSPIFGGLENRLASLVFGVPAVKGIEFGNGFGATDLHGSQNNDPFEMQGEEVKTTSNNHGGILGGISSSMPIIMRVAFKPTPSIAKTQNTIDYKQNQNSPLEIVGRHDPCVVTRAVPCVEACMAIALLDSMLEGSNPNGFNFSAR